MSKQSFSSGTKFEEIAGYSRAVRIGDRILVSGTTATGPDGWVGGDDPAPQARYALHKREHAIKQLGGQCFGERQACGDARDIRHRLRSPFRDPPAC